MELDLSADTPRMENAPDVIDIEGNSPNRQERFATVDDTADAQQPNNEEQTPFARRKRKKTSQVWKHVRTIKLADGTEKCECIHCGENATYALLSTALEIKEVFVNYADRECTYTTLPSKEDWKKVEEVCSFLALFNEATKLISGSEYPTSNLFLLDLFGIKEALDDLALDGKEYMEHMANKMKIKFDKYSGTCNLLISIAAVLDPRYKMELLNFSFKAIYSADEAPKQTKLVLDTLQELFVEYVEAHGVANAVSSSKTTVGTENGAHKSGSSCLSSRFCKSIKSGNPKYNQHIRNVDPVATVKSELDIYLEEGVYIVESEAQFDALEWWKEQNLKFRILSKMAADILAIPVTTVASESAFSAGGRVIDPHRASLGTNMIDMLICGADWYRQYYGVQKKKSKASIMDTSVNISTITQSSP